MWGPRSLRLVAIAAAAAVALGVGVYGLVRYVVNYERYRGFPPPVQVAGAPAGRVVTLHFGSPALGRRASAAVYLPPGYAAAARAGGRFPVLYLLHAPPGSPLGYLTIGALQVRMDSLIATHRIRPFLVAIPDGHTSRDSNDTEWANAGAGRYESFVLDTVNAVDRRFATIQARGDRALAGLSEGGYGAANVTLHQLATFGAFESWSGYFTQTPTFAFNGASRRLLAANSPNAYVGSLRARLATLPTYGFLYRGTSDKITSHADTVTFARRFRAAGGHVALAEYPGGHNWALWRAHLPQMLRFASAHFA
jgi:enterochelin esterase-like enzyme